MKRSGPTRILLSFLAATALLLGVGSQVSAHGEDIVGQVDPANEEVLTTTPASIRIKAEGAGEVEVSLRRAGGAEIPFTGETQRLPGLITLTPPALEPGTYILTWEHAGGSGASSFSVGQADATVDLSGYGGGGILRWMGLTLLLIGAFVVAGTRRRQGTFRVALASGAVTLVALGAGLVLEPSGLRSILAAGLVAIGAGILTGAYTFILPNRARAALQGAAALLSALAAWVMLTAPLFSSAGYLTIFATLGAVLVVAPTQFAGAFTGNERGLGLGVLNVPVLVLVLLAGVAGGGIRIATVESATVETSTCLDGTNRLEIQRCLEGSFARIASDSGVKAALGGLEDLLGASPKARYFCHEASHAIGRASLRLNGNLADAFRDGYDVCDFGYYHGIVEGAAAGTGDEEFKAVVPTLCADFASAEELFFMQCNHGIGHAAARRTNNDMLRALEFCDAIDKVEGLTGERLDQARNGCGTGVTMEWFAVATASEDAPVKPRVAAPRDVCHQVPQEWAAECYEYVGNTLDASDPVNSLRSLGGWCTESSQPGPCFKGLARAAAGVGISERDAISVCESSSDRSVRDECVRFYIATMATTIDYDVKTVDRICALLPERDREGAFSLCVTVREAVETVLAAGDGKGS